jgi:hypothetical protein
MAGHSDLSAYVRALGAKAKARQTSPLPYVTISRESGAGGREVGEALARLLTDAHVAVPWKCYDRELVDEIITDHNLSDKLPGRCVRLPCAATRSSSGAAGGS